MKKSLGLGVTFIILLLALTGCTNGKFADAKTENENSTASDGVSDSSNGVAAIKVIRSMMELDYESMSVAEFNKTISAMCEQANTTVFKVISDTYDHFSIYDDAGEFKYIVFNDADLEAFVNTTLEYSASEIFGEPVNLGNVSYMTIPGMTATELFEKRKAMQADEWNSYVEKNIDDFNMFPTLFYSIETDIKSTNAVLISERDSKINGIHNSIQQFFLGLDAKAIQADTLEKDILEELTKLSTSYSDDKITINCQIESLERDALK